MAKTNEISIADPEIQEIENTQLYLALTHPKLLRGLRAIARHAKNEEIEGGIAVYKTEHGVRVLDTIIPTPEELRATRGVLQSSIADMRRGYMNANLSSIALESNAQPRRDLLTLIHSHPLIGARSENKLYPSLGDMEAFEGLLTYNPELTSGILVSSAEATDLFLFKKSPNREYQQYFKRYDEDPSRITMLRTLNESGINFTTVRISKDEEPYEERVKRSIAELEE